MDREHDEVLALLVGLLQSKQRNELIQRDLDRFGHFSKSFSRPIIEYLQFSDTLLIWLQGESGALRLSRTPRQLVQTISYATCLTLASFISVGIPLRGAVGFGPIFVSREPLFFTGKQLYETKKLEKRQAWAGAMLHDSAVSALGAAETEPFLLQYPVPMSDCQASALRHSLAIDWVTPLSASPGLTPPWDRMFRSSANVKVGRKAEETRKFFDTVARLKRSAFPLHLSEGTIAGIRSRLQTA
jgi:hypothetical protein